MEAMNEITIGWERGDKFAEVDLPSNHRLNNRLKKLHEAYPDEFQRFVLNKDGTLFAKIPVKWIRIQRPSDNYHMPTEAEIEMATERLRKYNEERLQIKLITPGLAPCT